MYLPAHTGVFDARFLFFVHHLFNPIKLKLSDKIHAFEIVQMGIFFRIMGGTRGEAFMLWGQ